MLISIAIGFMIFGFLFVIFSATSVGGFGGGLTANQMLATGIAVFATGMTLCIAKTDRKNMEATIA